jgi:hypothetical protein
MAVRKLDCNLKCVQTPKQGFLETCNVHHNTFPTFQLWVVDLTQDPSRLQVFSEPCASTAAKSRTFVSFRNHILRRVRLTSRPSQLLKSNMISFNSRCTTALMYFQFFFNDCKDQGFTREAIWTKVTSRFSIFLNEANATASDGHPPHMHTTSRLGRSPHS